MFTSLGSDIWTVQGPNVDVMGFQYPTRMVIIRLSNRDLLVWSPIALTRELAAQTDALGVVKHIVSPNSLHHLFLSEWQAAYPNAVLHGTGQLQRKRKDITFDRELTETPDPDWSDHVDQVVFGSNAITSEVVFFHKVSGCIVFCDLIQHFPDGWFSGWRRVVAKLDLMVAPEPCVPRKFRIAFYSRNRKKARASFKRISAWPVTSVVMAHGAPVTQDAKRFLARAFAWL
ncbi:MAG: DUF4336 domain-containing protein [Pseudomonadota bacterium]